MAVGPEMQWRSRMSEDRKSKTSMSIRNEITFRVGACLVVLALWVGMLPLLPGVTVQAQADSPANTEKGQERYYLDYSEAESDSGSDLLNPRVLRALGTGSEQMTTTVSRDGQTYKVVAIEFDSAESRQRSFPSSAASRVLGTHTLATYDRFADVFVSSDNVRARLARLPGYVWDEQLGEVALPPKPEPETRDQPSRAVPDTIVRNGYGDLKGAGVIIAIVDSGVDFRHPDFIRYDEAGRPESRLLYLWDVGLDHQKGRGDPAPVDYPNEASIGTVFTKEQLTSELRSNTPSIPSTDRDGHGTSCASIAAGNGNADFKEGGLKRPSVVGVAPEADIIAVSLDLNRNGGLAGAFAVNAIVDWLDRVAGETPLVMSNSWGGHSDGHDGNGVQDRHLNARFPESKKGRAVLFAAGNEGDRGLHAEVNLTASLSQKTLELTVARNWVNTQGNPLPIPVRFYADNADTRLWAEPKALAGRVQKNPITGQHEGILIFSPDVRSIKIGNNSKTSVKLNLYIHESAGDFVPASRTRQGTVGSPGTISSVITVGSYDWNDNFHLQGSRVTIRDFVCGAKNKPIDVGALSCYSSVGPTRDGRQKPEIVAPGQWYTSSFASAVLPGAFQGALRDTTGKYNLMNGTSAATPYAAGIVALMFEKQPGLTSGEVKRLLMNNASRDPFTSGTPGPEWGAGKLNYAAVGKILAALDAQ
ncbi:MAG: hypothetical protein DWQ47_10065 [Acidobacteria bacterium]|nr:MAG: hypothetical protein DWQ32_12480 [Acidobacteriota bacterium]REJ98665.1 MAG: hypothetical protein DWQ38_15000 [Acidobacteriota bacterium]REK16679.1 MAG: hypothetical protein DWQ43_00325 [Acidobacteriota bacterium]REK42590.1 MAG: hypothetical protein DWQ47_10065 [Acidobacteriota bacterium]